MANGVELGTAYLSLTVDGSGLGQSIHAAANGSGAEEAGKGIGKKMADGLKTALKVGAVTAAAGVGAAIGGSIVGGFKSAIQQENAQKVLSGLYGSTKQATKMMERLHQVTKTSPISYESYTKAAENLAYAGVKGKEATSILRKVGLAITAAGGSDENLNSATDAILKMVNAGKVQLDTLQQLSDAGVPILSGLAKHFGVSIAQVNKMASKGKIKLDDVLSVMKNGTGKTFKSMIKSGKKAEGSFSNVFASIKDNVTTSIGKALVPALEKITPVMKKAGKHVQSFLDDLTTGKGAVGGFGKKVKAGFGKIKDGASGAFQIVKMLWNNHYEDGPIGPTNKLIPIIFKLRDAVVKAWNKIKPWLSDFKDGMVQAFKKIGPALKSIGGFFKQLWKDAQPLIHGAITAAFGAFHVALKVIPPVVSALFVGVKKLFQWLKPLTPIILGLTAAFVAYKVTMIAFNTATRIVIAAQRAYAAAQALVNAVMSANPIGLIIAALVALGVAFVVLWKKSETFRKIVKGAWEGIKKAALAVWHWMKKTLWPGIKKVWDWISSGFVATKDALVKAWHAIRDAFKAAWNWLKGTFKKWWAGTKAIVTAPIKAAWKILKRDWRWIKNVFSGAWGWIKGTFKKLWHGVEKILTDPIGAVKGFLERQVRGWKKIFSGAKKAIGKIWDGLKGIVKAPVNWVIKHVINHPLISGINALLPGNPIKPLKGFAKGTDSAPPGMAWVGERGPELMQFAGGERIYPAHVSRQMADRFGDVAPGFARGGRIPTLPGSTGSGKAMAWSGIEWYRPGWRKKLVNVLRQLQRKGWTVLEMMPFDRVDPVHSAQSLHYLPSRGHGNAADISRPGMKGADRVARMLEAMGFGVKWRAPGHFNHIHVDTSLLSNLGHGLQKNKGGGGGFFSGIFGGLWDKVSGLWDKVTGKFKDNKFAQIPIELGKKALTGLWDKAKSLFNPLNWFSNDATGHGKLGGNVAAKLKVKSAAAMYGWDHGYMWDAIKHIVRNESSWNPHARNPSSGAYGLFQALPPSKMNSVGRDWRTNADTQARWGMRYIAQRYGNPARAWDFWVKHHWYDQGGLLQPGATHVMNGTGKPEAVLTNPQWKTLERVADSHMGGGPQYIANITATSDDAKEIVLEWAWQAKRMTLPHSYGGVR